MQYLDGYLKACTVTTQPDHWVSANHLLRLYSPEQAEAEATSSRVLDALWQVTNDELFADAQAVDSAQGEYTDWRI